MFYYSTEPQDKSFCPIINDATYADIQQGVLIGTATALYGNSNIKDNEMPRILKDLPGIGSPTPSPIILIPQSCYGQKLILVQLFSRCF